MNVETNAVEDQVQELKMMIGDREEQIRALREELSTQVDGSKALENKNNSLGNRIEQLVVESKQKNKQYEELEA